MASALEHPGDALPGTHQLLPYRVSSRRRARLAGWLALVHPGHRWLADLD